MLLLVRRRTHHFNVLFDSSVSNPSRVLSITKILAIREVTGSLALLVQWFSEEGIADTELLENTLIIDASICHNPESHAIHCIGKLRGECLLTTWLVEA